MAEAPRQIAVLGSTGSIGKNALRVIAASGGRLQVAALSAHSQLDLLVAQAVEFSPRWVVATDIQVAEKFDWSKLPKGTELLMGSSELNRVVGQPQIDVVLAAIVGRAGLESTWAALDSKKTVALANKETLVMAGPLVMQLARERGATLIPVDSEHSAIAQALRAGQTAEVERLVLTASGGAFRHLSQNQLKQVTVAEALEHPNWDMGPKITVDSATMMNKALEIIEAHWLFDVPSERIEVAIHPQSVVHSLVEFVDGSVIAQMSPPDMRLPIQYALYYPDRVGGVAERLDWGASFSLEFSPPDPDRYPALELGHQCARSGGTSGTVLNGANEAAVGSFLAGELHFTEIVPACRSVLQSHNFESDPTLDRLIDLDRWARQEVSHWVFA
ncbi:1-deoxy-D-xylulose-5-phosphate reductoisomerase [Bythopirellula polymerisocia]|uniref:1-deoxy-D-xylulose 5-phosphate reductoisomerase n=1 Tax=Bythopirellula polymerisocia TaxID=2528003 RepID=A0A5C6D0M9_9BACT|nr:1-deoxy-D-xylulose-5-phosphate reductoisomerase [Bythopirellula polymerisocia]TWU29301.1 1-deoxy-D-xylulose 5-phosphate reductoisomerase [Bythopirellula polymerisocia]